MYRPKHKRRRKSLDELIRDTPCQSCLDGYSRAHVCDLPDYCPCDRTSAHVQMAVV
jgi:hypothetical protein